MSKAFIDFAVVRRDYPLLDVAQKLGIKVRPDGNKHRGQCPFTDCQNLRSFTITPKGGTHGDGICGCFKCGRNGMDSIGLVQKLNDMQRMPEAARYIVELMGGKAHAPEEQKGLKEVSRNFQASAVTKLDLLKKVAEDLDPDHERIEAAGISSETAVAFVAGYAGRGVARGHVIVQLHDPKGTLIGYVGLEEPMWLPKDIAATVEEHVFGWHRVTEGPVKLLASPIEVLRYLEVDPEGQAVAFLTPEMQPTQLKYLADLLSQKGCTLSP